jgi:hypothetical protein
MPHHRSGFPKHVFVAAGLAFAFVFCKCKIAKHDDKTVWQMHTTGSKPLQEQQLNATKESARQTLQMKKRHPTPKTKQTRANKKYRKMKIVSFDVGVKHLACVCMTLDRDQKQPRIDWKLWNVCHDQGWDQFDDERTCSLCHRTAQCMQGDESKCDYRCGIHSRSKSENWVKLTKTKVSQVKPVEVHVRLWQTLLNHHDELADADVVLIENQNASRRRGRVQNSMNRVVATILYSFFLHLHSQDKRQQRAVPALHFVHAAKRWKLPEQFSIPELLEVNVKGQAAACTFEPSLLQDSKSLSITAAKAKRGAFNSTYTERKVNAEKWTRFLLQRWQWDADAFDRFQRRHDLADAFLSAIAFLGPARLKSYTSDRKKA